MVAGEVHVLHPQAQGFEQPQAGAVQEQGGEARRPVERVEDGLHLLAGEHHRDPLPVPGAHDVVEPGQRLPEDVAIEKQQRAQGLVLRRGGHVALDGPRAQEPRDLGGPHVGRVALVVEEDVAPDPADVGLLRAEAAVAGAQRRPDAIQQPRRGRCLEGAMAPGYRAGARAQDVDMAIHGR
jgi:hypothetical protein